VNDAPRMIGELEKLRDQFAMAALPFIAETSGRDAWDYKSVAKAAYQLADEMLEARNK
jgi:hypothetical protein